MNRLTPLWCIFVVLCFDLASFATPTIQDAWTAKYPTSTLPARMAAQTGSACNVCHHPSSMSNPGNCYREAIIVLLDDGVSIVDAIDQLDAEDSDGDGAANGVEATTTRADDPGEVGYNMGLVGDTGTDPCGADPGEQVTGVLETPPPEAIPTISAWGALVMGLFLLTAGTVAITGRQVAR